jgi:hypothetical protein
MWGALSDGRTGLSFTIPPGPRQRSHFRVRLPWDSWPFYCLRFETSLFVASYNSQVYGGGIRPRLHTRVSLIPSLVWPPFITSCEPDRTHRRQGFHCCCSCIRLLETRLGNRALASRWLAMDGYYCFIIPGFMLPSVVDSVTSGTCLPSRCLAGVMSHNINKSAEVDQYWCEGQHNTLLTSLSSSSNDVFARKCRLVETPSPLFHILPNPRCQKHQYGGPLNSLDKKNSWCYSLTYKLNRTEKNKSRTWTCKTP